MPGDFTLSDELSMGIVCRLKIASFDSKSLEVERFYPVPITLASFILLK